MRLKKLVTLFALLAAGKTASAAMVTASWDGAAGPGACGSSKCNRLVIDDSGGEEGAFAFEFADRGHTAHSGLIVSNGTQTDAGNKYSGSGDFTGSGVVLVTGPFANFPDVDFIAQKTSSLPVMMTADNTGFTVEQRVFVIGDKDYAILEVRAVNNGGTPSDIFIGMINEWDVNGTGSDDDAAGFDAARSLVYQQDDNDLDGSDETEDPASIGMSAIGAPELLYFLGGNNSLARLLNGAAFADPYALIEHFLNETKPVEECDDGNTADGDGCNSDCRTGTPAAVKEGCGNGAFDADEECDDGNNVSGDGCDLFCRAEFKASAGFGSCGDGFVNSGATGDQIYPGSVPNTDLESDLAAAFRDVPAGGGVTVAFCLAGGTEASLSGSLAHLKTAIDDCRTFYDTNIGVCGNGFQNAGEACDDGNLVDGDGCSAVCATEVAGGATTGGTTGGDTSGGGTTGAGGSTGETTGGGTADDAAGPGGGCALIVVDSTLDAPDVSGADGLCATAAGDCTLRAAAQQIDASADASNGIAFDSDVFPPDGSAVIALGGFLPAFQFSTDVIGPGSTALKITGYGLRCHDFAATSVACRFSGLTLAGGVSSRGIEVGQQESVEMTDVVVDGFKGGINVLSGGTAVLRRSVLIRNEVKDQSGGGIRVGIGGSMTFEDGLIAQNKVIDSASFPDVYGGGVFNSGTLILRNAVIAGNASPDKGGGIYNGPGGTVTIERSLLSANRALKDTAPVGGQGGGIYNTGNSSTVTITNATLSGNVSGDEGGALYNDSDTGNAVALKNVTVFGNAAFVDGGSGGGGGGIYQSAGTSNAVTLTNTILAGNDANAGSGDDCFTEPGAVVASGGFTLRESASGCDGYVGAAGDLLADPFLLPLDPPDGGNPALDQPAGSHEPSAASPVLDHGPSDPSQFPATDQRGTPRPLGAASDIGAVETGCGDGKIRGSEACDDGNAVPGDGCDGTCSLETPPSDGTTGGGGTAGGGTAGGSTAGGDVSGASGGCSLVGRAISVHTRGLNRFGDFFFLRSFELKSIAFTR